MLHNTSIHNNTVTVVVHTKCAFPGTDREDMREVTNRLCSAMGVSVHESHAGVLALYLTGQMGGMSLERAVPFFTFAEQTCFASLRKHLEFLSNASHWEESLWCYENSKTGGKFAVLIEEVLWEGDDEE